MQVIYGISKIRHYPKPVVALGVFDGVHRAHRAILSAAVRQALRIKGTSIALTFWPHPQKKESLYSLEHRLRLIRETGIEVALVVKFSRGFSQISAERFIRDFLVSRIRVNRIFIGKNFRFGQGAKGDWRLLEKFSRRYNYKVRAFEIIRHQGSAISSSSLRRLITDGELSRAQELLLRPVSIFGTVIKGESRASGLGFPTANIDPHHEVIPPDGIYAVRVILGKRMLKGICYIGTKPTFRKAQSRVIEAHIFGFRKNIYGKNMEIQFIGKLRDDRKFASALLLARQVKIDISRAKKLFSRT